LLEATIRKYQNRIIEAAQVIAELIELAKQMREGQKRGENLGLTDDEVAFYDALEVNDSAVKVLGEPALKNIARESVSHVRKSVTIDWTLREAAQAQIRVLVRRILRKYGYPPTSSRRQLKRSWSRRSCSVRSGLHRGVSSTLTFCVFCAPLRQKKSVAIPPSADFGAASDVQPLCLRPSRQARIEFGGDSSSQSASETLS
jgi:hypothetical protein